MIFLSVHIHCSLEEAQMGVLLYQTTQHHVPEHFNLKIIQLVDGGDCELIFQQVDKMTKQIQLETQLADAKLAKVKMEMAAEKEVLLKEKQQLLMVTDMFEAFARGSEGS
jgi:hypothetical protein